MDQSQLEAFARSHVDQMVAGIREVAANNAHLTAGAETYSVSGSFAWATAFIYTTLYTNPTLDYGSGEKFTFNGTAWGLGLGGGKMWVTGLLTVPAAQLAGPCDFGITVTGPVTTIHFTRNGGYLGSVVGAGLSVGASGSGGSGEFKRA